MTEATTLQKPAHIGEKRMKCYKALPAVGLAVTLVAAAAGTGMAVRADVVTAKELVKSAMNDPESVQWRNIEKFNEYVVCGEYNGKNKFGGYVGFTRFVYAKGFTFDYEPSDKQWNDLCRNKVGKRLELVDSLIAAQQADIKKIEEKIAELTEKGARLVEERKAECKLSEGLPRWERPFECDPSYRSAFSADYSERRELNYIELPRLDDAKAELERLTALRKKLFPAD